MQGLGLAPELLAVEVFEGELDVLLVLDFPHPLEGLHGDVLAVYQLLDAQVELD